MPTLKLGSTTAMTESGGTVTLDSAITGNTAITGLGTVTTGNISHADIVYPSGHVLQVQGTHNDYDWGSWGHSNETVCDWINVVLTTRGTNSNFWVIGKMNADNTPDSTAFGIGIGFRYQPTGGSEVTICNAHEHENYDGHTIDHYLTAYSQIYEQGATIAKGTEVTFKVYMEFNNSNGQRSTQQQHGSSHTVMEIQA